MSMENGTSKKARILRKQQSAFTKPPRQEGGEEDSKTVHACLDPDTLECPLCFLPFEAAIFQASTSLSSQCKNGHAACEGCCTRIRGTCPSCREPVGDIRCRPLENAIASMLLPCAFTGNGCTRRLKIAEKRAHESLLCPHASCACPIKGCVFSGVELYDHILVDHAGDAGVVKFVRSTMVALRRDTPFRVLLHLHAGWLGGSRSGGGPGPTWRDSGRTANAPGIADVASSGIVAEVIADTGAAVFLLKQYCRGIWSSRCEQS
ncbi:hypothetical protein PR202_gb26592 [Eleusine coracana subsp. coracana]|uniref:SIAH-type domain-containing protein n=1 Tax=Eleusine coracana subsp. coracana TaxID=191504 RepID=A0AAV5FPA2_ELECO|nr:hypothetical protein PR202_gb26592 [Eleusine coracana subsp. coracana]